MLGTEVVDVAWADNGPGWIAALLPSADDVLTLEPDWEGTLDLKLGVVGPAGGARCGQVREGLLPAPALRAQLGELDERLGVSILGLVAGALRLIARNVGLVASLEDDLVLGCQRDRRAVPAPRTGP